MCYVSNVADKKLVETKFQSDKAVLHMKGVKKQNLPEKICIQCGRPFSWRKKWERCWEEVKYCSEACKKKPS
jgi:hypothetical protein